MSLNLCRTSIYQTGLAIFVDEDGNEKRVPLFTHVPFNEAKELQKQHFKNYYSIKGIFYTNEMMSYRMEDLIKEFLNKHHFLPQNYVDELASGFPHIPGHNPSFVHFYK